MIYSKISAVCTDDNNGNKIPIVLTHCMTNFVLVLQLRQKLLTVLLRQLGIKNCQRLCMALISSVLFLCGNLGFIEPQSIPEIVTSVKIFQKTINCRDVDLKLNCWFSLCCAMLDLRCCNALWKGFIRIILTLVLPDKLVFQKSWKLFRVFRPKGVVSHCWAVSGSFPVGNPGTKTSITLTVCTSSVHCYR